MAKKIVARKKTVRVKPAKRRISKAPARVKPARRKAAKPPARPRLSPRELDLLIQKTAYELYARRGYIHGRSWEDWLEAERIVLSKNR
jgi:hypothetical protein